MSYSKVWNYLFLFFLQHAYRLREQLLGKRLFPYQRQPLCQLSISAVGHDLALALVGEAKIDAERRVDEALDLAAGCDLGERLEVAVVEVDDFEVGLDARLGDGLWQDGGTAGDLSEEIC